MAGQSFTTQSIPIAQKQFGDGLNSTAGPFGVAESESSDLQNIDFDQFGSILKRNGYTRLNPVITTGTSLTSDGLYWFEASISGTNMQYAINVAGGSVTNMSGVSGTWSNITGTATISPNSHCDFETFLNEVYITNGTNPPLKWTGGSNVVVTGTPVGLAYTKYVRQFNNYLFYGNVKIGSDLYPSRIYWSNFKDTSTWDAVDWIEISKDDGDEITGLKVLSDRLVIYKNNSIYSLFFTGDSDIPFILPGGGKTNSNVGCVAPFSIQEVNNGHVFFSYDGLYYFDGTNSFKLSDRIRTTLLGYSKSAYTNAVSLNYKTKNRYMLAMASNTTIHDKVVVWDYAVNSFSIYSGIAASAMSIFRITGIEERPYFSDYNGYTYRMDTTNSDNPLGVKTAINAYYYTNWKHFDDLINQKGIAQIEIYYQLNTAIVTFSYSYDFISTDQFITTFNTAGPSTALWGSVVWGNFNYASTGGGLIRKDLTGRGRVVRFKFSNNTIDETFRIDGLGMLPHLETHV